jgi:ParB family chromosome partitioning protein
MIRLLKNGEERLLSAVEQRRIPLSMAISIAESDDQEIQRMMTEAYEKKELRGPALLAARRLLEQRKNQGKGMYERAKTGESVAPNALIRVYKKETAKLQLMAKKASVTDTRLGFITTAMKRLFGDREFIDLLKAESFESLPIYLAEQIKEKGKSHG